MILLALETSGPGASVTVLDDETAIGRADIGPRETAKMLVPAIASVLDNVGLSTINLDVIAVTAGPGSFTGLRLGVTTAKTLAYATAARLIGVNSLDVIAAQSTDTNAPIECIMDAHRGQLFTARYLLDGGQGRPVRPTAVQTVEQWLESLQPGSLVIGPAVRIVEHALRESHRQVKIAAENTWYPDAESVGKLAWMRHERQQYDDLWSLEPSYYRVSAAEEKAGS